MIELSNRLDVIFSHVQSLWRAGDLTLATQLLTREFHRNPSDVAIAHNLSVALYYEGRFGESLSLLVQVESIESNANTRYMASLVFFALKNFKHAFRAYDNRWAIENFPSKRIYTKLPEWCGQSTGRVLIWGEQGIGDELMFTYAFRNLFGSIGECRALMVIPKMVQFYNHQSLEADIIPWCEDINHSSFDFHLPVGSIGKHFEVFKDHPKHFDSPIDHKLLPTGGNGFLSGFKLIGVSWFTRSPDGMSGFRNIDLIQMLKLVSDFYSDASLQFVSLQYGEVNDEVELARKAGYVMFSPSEDLFDDTLLLSALIGRCEEVITIDNFVCHLAGALGVPTTILLPRLGQWRWGNFDDTVSYWYSSVKLRRQPRLGDWLGVLEDEC